MLVCGGAMLLAVVVFFGMVFEAAFRNELMQIAMTTLSSLSLIHI